MICPQNHMNKPETHILENLHFIVVWQDILHDGNFTHLPTNPPMTAPESPGL